MPVGEYKLEDGKVLIVAVEGIIGEVKDAMPEEAPMETPEVEVEVEAEVAPEAPSPKRICRIG